MSLEFASVGDVAEQIRGVTYGKDDASDSALPGYVPILRAGNITDDGLVFDDLVYVPSERVSPKQRVRRYDVVIAASSGSLDVVGKAATAAGDFDGSFGAFCKVLRPNARVHPGYFAHYFKTPEYRRRASLLASGVNINNLRNEHLDELKIPLPRLSEQHRIATILDQAEALRAKRREAVAKLNTLARSMFLEMFGDPISNPREWPMRRFEEIGDLERGVSKHRPRNDPILLGGPYPLVQTGDIANCDGHVRTHQSSYSEVGLRQSRLWPKGTLCITIAANIAKTGILAFDACFPDSVVGFRPNDSATVEYVRAWLGFLQASLEAAAPESAQKNINLAILRSLMVPLPPVDMQLLFARRIGSAEALAERYRANSEKFDNLFASLQHRAFRGEL
jgi:type I restriction enzyme, S subunit